MAFGGFRCAWCTVRQRTEPRANILDGRLKCSARSGPAESARVVRRGKTSKSRDAPNGLWRPSTGISPRAHAHGGGPSSASTPEKKRSHFVNGGARKNAPTNNATNRTDFPARAGRTGWSGDLFTIQDAEPEHGKGCCLMLKGFQLCRLPVRFTFPPR